MIIKTQADFDGITDIGKIVGKILRESSELVKPKNSLLNIDQFVRHRLVDMGAAHAPILRKGFPSHICISVNEQAVHGIPSNRLIKNGDLIKLDLIAEKNGYLADSAITIGVGQISKEKQDLIKSGEEAFWGAVNLCKVGEKISTLSKFIEETAANYGFFSIKTLHGHGVGRDIWEKPTIHNYYEPSDDAVIEEGMVLAIEPIISNSSPYTDVLNDNWTVVTRGGGLASHYEHTLIVQKDKNIVVTCLDI